MTAKALVGQEQEVISRYKAGEKPADLGRAYGVSNVTIFNLLKRNNVQLRTMSQARTKYSVPHGFFDVIDTEEKAYILGLWYADGSNRVESGRVALALKDSELVERVRDILSPDRPVKEQYVPGCAPSYQLVFSNRLLSEALEARGCGSRKTFNLTFPDLNKDIVHHFVRGYFDGDGCIHRRKDSENYVVHILGTEDFLRGMSGVIGLTASIKQRSNTKIWFYGLYSKANVIAFAQWLYRDATIYMKRKRTIFSFCLEPHVEV